MAQLPRSAIAREATTGRYLEPAAVFTYPAASPSRTVQLLATFQHRLFKFGSSLHPAFAA
jgi:hypothetical protein